MKITAQLLRCSTVGALGGLLFGFDTAVISGTTQQLSEVFRLSAVALGITVSIALWGTVAGCAGSGVLGQKLGGRSALRVMAMLYIISAIGCAAAWSWPALLVFRFIGGLGIGGSSVLGPVYIAEVAPARWRGRLVGIFQINIVLGILAAYLSNYIISTMNLGAAEWRWELGIATLPAVLFLVMLYTIPQSPRWMAARGRSAEALAVLRELGSENPQAEIAAIEASLVSTGNHEDVPLFQRRYALPIFLAASIGLFNQLAGVNAILYYATDIFRAAGFSRLSGNLQSVLIGLMNLVGTFIGMSLIDRAGRKTLLIFGSIGTGFCLAGVAAVFFSHSHPEMLVWLLMAFICFFAASQGAVIWVYIAEVFPTQVRSKGQSLGSGSHWIMNAIIAFAFPVVAQRSSGAPFLFFASMMVLQLIVVWRVYPETKGRTLEELQAELQGAD
ncbi:sugar porter family MFS transporter [Occallatibacter riparius]|uniref:Sugar porter family MFS transporter n=1 Tax=Occallatibacter riparius TaxID=1002689 RepID=A0A9J7BVB4_9BACT|nr:sugar porter family MFS transporter [Occallatibacter riparius]UWZ86819.1 sugar porter family MFS transporter [Occallatibacter riparius]